MKAVKTEQAFCTLPVLFRHGRGGALTTLRAEFALRTPFHVLFQPQDAEPGKQSQKGRQGAEKTTPEARSYSVHEKDEQEEETDEPGGLIG